MRMQTSLTALAGAAALGAAVLAPAGPARAAICVPVTAGALNQNGVVVGRQLGGAGGPPGACAGDLGWAGVPTTKFKTVGGVDDTLESDLLMVGQGAGANVDNLWLGIHVENDDTFANIDGVVLYFDVNGDGTFSADDFALSIEAGPTTPVTDTGAANEQCQQNPNNALIYRFSDGAWGAPQPIPGAITMKTSWDYDTVGDVEHNIWELEMRIVPGALSPVVTIPKGSQMRVGAKLFLYRVGNSALEVLTIPNGLATDQNPNNVTPSDGAITTLGAGAQVDVGACPFDVVLESISGTSAPATGALPGKFTRFPNPIAGTLGAGQTNNFSATVRLVNQANPLDTSPLGVPNAGTATMRIKPWNMGFTGDFIMGTPAVSFSALGQTRNVSLSWPQTEAQYAPARALLASADHACFVVDVAGFAIDSNAGNNNRMQNLVFTTASTIKDSFIIQAPRARDGRDPFQVDKTSGTSEFLLRTDWDNVPGSLISPPEQPKPGQWSFRFPTASKIGLKHVGKGVYSIRLKPGEQRVVELELTGAQMPVASRTILVSPKAGGRNNKIQSGHPAVKVPVKPGSVLSVVATGAIKVSAEHQPNGPEGFVEGRQTPPPTDPTGKQPPGSAGEFLMSRKSSFVPAEHVGALIGSFDGFKTAFVIAGARTFVVPDKAKTLLLAVNDRIGAFTDNSGKGFEITLLSTPPSRNPTRLSAAGNPNNGLPAVGALGANIPRFSIDMLAFDRARKLLRPNGYVTYVVYASHPEGTQPPPKAE
jgi:hypothetical protein